MSETPSKKPAASEEAGAVVAPEPGPVSQWLNKQGFDHDILEPDHLGVEQIGVQSPVLPMIAAALKSNGFDYLQCQGGYDEGPGEQLVCFYHLLAMAEQVEAMAADPSAKLREVRIKVFLSREGTPSLPSIYGLFRGADWQERVNCVREGRWAGGRVASGAGSTMAALDVLENHAMCKWSTGN